MVRDLMNLFYASLLLHRLYLTFGWRILKFITTYLFIHLFIHLFRKHLLNPPYMLVNLQAIQDIAVKKSLYS